MSARRVGPGALACALALACGERAGEPIVAAASAQGEAGQSMGGGAVDPPPDGAAGEAPSELVGPIGLCGACTTSDSCGDANDACLRHDAQSFCGRDCDEQGGCPNGYTCVELANSQLWQCVPETTCPTPSPAPALADLRQAVLSRINAERSARDRAPFSASSCLDQLAQESAIDFARTDEPLGKYVKECDPVWPNCVCGWNSEAEISIARYGLDWTTAVEHAIGPYRDPANDRFTQAFLSSEVSDIGIGFWIAGDEAWIALSFR